MLPIKYFSNTLFNLYLRIVITAAIVIAALEANAEFLLQESHNQESITYWKTFEISPSEDPKVKEANEIFERLLLGWEGTRVAPNLHVVRSDKGPWAASLDDGTILLSRDAIDVCFKVNDKGGRDRLAFVLAHELSHQRADHLWHRRFFRLAGQQPPKVRGRMLGNISLDKIEEDIEKKEIQADREGIILMSMVGFDPYIVAGEGNRFFYEWTESIWGEFCSEGDEKLECTKARNRTDRIRVHWQEIIQQSVLFDLGVQSYVAGKYILARKYFTAYGRQFPGREIHNNIGLTYIGEALSIRNKILSKGGDLGPEFIYPFILEEVGIRRKKSKNESGTRGGGLDINITKLKKEMDDLLGNAASSFEMAIKIDPEHRQSYWNLIAAYLLMKNAPLAYGMAAGNYVKRFEHDAIIFMYLGISAYLDGQIEKSLPMLNKSVSEASQELLPFTRINRAVYFGDIGDKNREKAEWKSIADWGRKNGDQDIFQFALKRLGKKMSSQSILKKGTTEKIHGYTIGQRVPALVPGKMKAMSSDVWVEGERIQIYWFNDGSRMAVDSNRVIISLWQDEGSAKSLAGVNMGDDASKIRRAYGNPSQRIWTINGEYWKYDNSTIAFRIINKRVLGWFVYDLQG